jgi:hypothetical protein
MTRMPSESQPGQPLLAAALPFRVAARSPSPRPFPTYPSAARPLAATRPSRSAWKGLVTGRQVYARMYSFAHVREREPALRACCPGPARVRSAAIWRCFASTLLVSGEERGASVSRLSGGQEQQHHMRKLKKSFRRRTQEAAMRRPASAAASTRQPLRGCRHGLPAAGDTARCAQEV